VFVEKTTEYSYERTFSLYVRDMCVYTRSRTCVTRQVRKVFELGLLCIVETLEFPSANEQFVAFQSHADRSRGRSQEVWTNIGLVNNNRFALLRRVRHEFSNVSTRIAIVSRTCYIKRRLRENGCEHPPTDPTTQTRAQRSGKPAYEVRSKSSRELSLLKADKL